MSLNVQPARVAEDVQDKRRKLADRLEKELANDTPWYEFPTPAAYRRARRDGTHGFKRPPLNNNARMLTIYGRDKNAIELRIIDPTTGPSRGVWLHFHAGLEIIVPPIPECSELTYSRWLRGRKQCFV